MAKELPYFKFEPGAWDSGNIQMCSRESKGLFIELCSLYWSRCGELPYALALQKLCNGDNGAFDELVNADIFLIIDGFVVIEFLDEQLEEFQETSKKRAKAANKRWSDASALQKQSKSNAIREEKRREDKRREEKNGSVAKIPFDENTPVGKAWMQWEVFRKEKRQKLLPSTIEKQVKFLGGRSDPEIIEIINQSIRNGWTGLFEIKSKTHDNFKSNSSTSRTTSATIDRNYEYKPDL